jgi:hypothetical protein
MTPPATSPASGAEPPATAASDDEAKRIAAQKRRDKAAKDKADRDAKALADQQAAAARAAAADAARKRADDAQRAKAAAVAPPVVVAPPAPKPRTVREICADRGFFSQQICQSRECSAPEHESEALCKELKDINDRRRNLQN